MSEAAVTADAPRSVGSRITEEAVERLRAKLGQVVTSSHSPYLTETSRDGVRHWAEGIGDGNPLWTDEAVGRASPWGKPLSPPTVLYAFDKLAIGYRGGLPGVHSMFGGSDWHWLRPIAWGERIAATVRFIDLIERPSRFAGRAFQQISEITFRTDGGETVAVARSWGFRTERTTAAERGKYRRVEVCRYTPDELNEIAARYRNEAVRGATPRYVENVRAGEVLTPIIRGPYTATTAVAFEQGWGGLFIKAHGQAMDYFTRHPSAGILNDFGVPEPPEAVHWDNELARKVGVPAAYDYGPERISWIGTLLTNWIGNAGFLERLHVQVRNHNIVGDLTTCCARVVAVPGGAEGAVELEVWAENQRGEITARGEARVLLPSRAAGQQRPVTPAEQGLQQ
ncbi:MAG: MaoC family dehydratase N-terminal domain-containing protein [Lautropia sp.]